MYTESKEFYPTPLKLISKMLSDIDFRNGNIRTVLEPSAGAGHIAEEILHKLKQCQRSCYSREEKKFDIDCIELDENLRYILQGKGFRIVHDDFLTYSSYKRYDLIVMNPPFSNGDKHLLRALELIKNGGSLICILNAETLKNSYSNTRKDLLHRLNNLNAKIEYLKEEFVDSERSTEVEIALIKIQTEKTKEDSLIINQLKQEEKFNRENHNNSNTLINSDFIQGIIQQYNFEVKVGVKLINEYENLQPLILKSFKENNSPILNLTVDNNSRYIIPIDLLINDYIKKVRYKYWEALFNNPEFTSLLTSNLLYEYRDKITELQDYDFSYYNIKEIQLQMNKNIIKGVEDTILSLFNEFSHKHSWYAESSNNVHYYNGWANNSAHKINKKIIIPLNAFNSYDGRLEFDYKFREKLQDIERVFNYLDGGRTKETDLKQILDNAVTGRQTKYILSKYFSISVFKKGTCHLTFLDEELLKKFNIFGSQKLGFLPNSYGKKKYKHMTKEERQVIDEFEGEDSYNNTINDTEYYIYNPNKILMIGA